MKNAIASFNSNHPPLLPDYGIFFTIDLIVFYQTIMMLNYLNGNFHIVRHEIRLYVSIGVGMTG